jgi:hypothetical protein
MFICQDRFQFGISNFTAFSRSLVTFLGRPRKDETVKSPMKFGRLQHDAHLLLLLQQYMVVVIASFDFLRDHQEK